MAQTILSSLKLTDKQLSKPRGEFDPLPNYREQLVERLKLNKQVAEHMIARQKNPDMEAFIVRREQVVIDPETKKPKKVNGKLVKEVLPVKRWEPDFLEVDGVWYFQIKKNRDVLAKIEVGKVDKLVKIIDTCIKSVEANELDDKLTGIAKASKEKAAKRKKKA